MSESVFREGHYLRSNLKPLVGITKLHHWSRPSTSFTHRVQTLKAKPLPAEPILGWSRLSHLWILRFLLGWDFSSRIITSQSQIDTDQRGLVERSRVTVVNLTRRRPQNRSYPLPVTNLLSLVRVRLDLLSPSLPHSLSHSLSISLVVVMMKHQKACKTKENYFFSIIKRIVER